MPKIFPSVALTINFSIMLTVASFSQSLKKSEYITLNFGEKNLKGSAVTLDFDRKKAFKAWWKYSRKFSRTQTFKDYLLHTIPPVEGESTESLIFYSRVEKVNDSSSKVNAALAKNGMDDVNLRKYQEQVENLLIDFRMNFYAKNLQKKITETEKKATKVSRTLDKQITKGYKLRQDLRKAESESSGEQVLAGLKEELNVNQQNQNSISLQLSDIQKNIDSYKKTMGEIK